MNPTAPKAMRIPALALLLFFAACGSGMAETADGDGRFVISPPYAPAPEVIANDQVPQGTVHEFTMNSADSAIYPKDVATGEPFTRSVSVYIPAQYQAGTAAPFMVVQDGVSFYQGTMVPTLDNMIHAGTLPVMIVIFVEPGPNGGPTEGQRSYEYDSVSEDYVTFVETELLPKVEQDYGVSLTTDPDGRAAMGGSSGGAAAFTMGWFRPDKYRRILTYSGSFCNLQSNATHPHGAWEYHESLIASSPAKPLRVALSASEYDIDMNTDTEQMRNWVAANEAMAAALAAKGYEYRYVYAEGADHVDFGVLEQTLPETLRWLWQGYPSQSP
jgi:iron(III)-enterobactin esterase